MAIFNPQKHHRRSIRLKGYDYTQAGAYFITLVTYQRECLFGEVAGSVMQLNPAGEMVRCGWQGLENRFPNIILDEFTIMPNHFHGIIVIFDVGALLAAPAFESDAIDKNATNQGAASSAPTKPNPCQPWGGATSGGETPPLRRRNICGS